VIHISFSAAMKSIIFIGVLSIMAVSVVALPVNEILDVEQTLSLGFGGVKSPPATTAPTQPAATRAPTAALAAPAAPNTPPAATAAKYCADTCTEKRVRKSWNFLTTAERALYIEAVKALYTAGVYTKFVMIHQDGINDPFAHGTSGFLPWHRKFLIEYENALRCLDVKFQCVTIPTWDWSEWQYYCNQQGGCSSYHEVPAGLKKDNANAESLLAAFGGPGTKGGSGKPFGGTGQKDGVGCVTTGPFAGWQDWEGNCLTRGVNWDLKDSANGPLTDKLTLLTLTTNKDVYGVSDGYRAGLQGTPHNMAHNYLGGHMRSMRSPMDPIFFSHHAFVDKNWALWQDCKDFENTGRDKLTATQYEGTMPKPAVGFTGVSDYIDAPMPYKITLSPFKPDAKQCSEAAGANSACRKCLKTIRTQDDWCSARWHPSCEGICADNACRSVCGTGGEAQEISATTFARSDGKAFPYSFDYHKNGPTPRDWSATTDKLKQPFEYAIEQFDTEVGKTACNMCFEKNAELELVQVYEADKALFAGVVQKVMNMMGWTNAKDKFQGDLAAIKAKEGGTNKQVVIKGVTKQMIDQCAARDNSTTCKGEFGTSGKCRWTCSGPVSEQPEICGFQAAFNYKLVDKGEAVSDLCAALKLDGLVTKAPTGATSSFFASG